MRKKHGSVPKLHTCSGLDSRDEQKHWHSRCHYKRNSGSPSAGANNPTPWGGPAGQQKTDERLVAARSDYNGNHPRPGRRSSFGSGFGAGVTTGGLSPAEDENQPFRPGTETQGYWRPSRVTAAHLSRHGWRKSPRSWRMPFSPRRQGKKRTTDPRGGSPPTRLILHLGLDDENP
jgi:hypothetical protein